MRLSTGRLFKEQYAFFHNRAYWKVELSTNQIWCELDERLEILPASRQELQWYDDIVATGDVLKIRHLWLYGPRTEKTPQGGTIRFEIKESGTAFCWHGATFNLGNGRRLPSYLACGRVLDKMLGICELGIWDYKTSQLYIGKTNITDIGKWREDGPPVGKLDFERIGLRL